MIKRIYDSGWFAVVVMVIGLCAAWALGLSVGAETACRRPQLCRQVEAQP